MTAARPSPARSADDVLANAEWALVKALIPRGGRRHLRTCLARHVNSQTVPCSDDCLKAQGALARLHVPRVVGASDRRSDKVPPYWQSSDGRLVIYHGDARDILPSLNADVLLTDPPYGVEFGGKTTRHTARSGEGYTTRDDAAIGPLVVREALAIVNRGAVFPGIRNLTAYPIAQDIGCVYCPSGAGIGPWGFVCFHPVLFYGKRTGTLRPSSIVSFATAPPNGHPCPKPFSWMRWLVDLCSTTDDVILDPFMGSGTTLEAARSRNRRAIGIEVDESYCRIAVERLNDPPLLAAMKAEQASLWESVV